MKYDTRVRLLRPSAKLRCSRLTGTVKECYDDEYQCYRVKLDAPPGWVWPSGHISPGDGDGYIYELAENLEIIATT